MYNFQQNIEPKNISLLEDKLNYLSEIFMSFLRKNE